MIIDWTEVIISLCSVLITGVIVPLAVHTYKTKTTKAQQDTIEYWVETGVRWAKQWLQTAEGAEKKQQVLDYVWKKLDDLGIDVELEDIDKLIEATYEQVKEESRKTSSAA